MQPRTLLPSQALSRSDAALASSGPAPTDKIDAASHVQLSALPDRHCAAQPEASSGSQSCGRPTVGLVHFPSLKTNPTGHDVSNA